MEKKGFKIRLLYNQILESILLFFILKSKNI